MGLSDFSSTQLVHNLNFRAIEPFLIVSNLFLDFFCKKYRFRLSIFQNNAYIWRNVLKGYYDNFKVRVNL